MESVCALVLAAMALQSPVTRAVEGISNGGFGDSWTNPDTSAIVYGEFWVGSEGRTQPGGMDRILHFAPGDAGERVYQRVSCPDEMSATFVLGGQARIAQSGDRAYITFIEGLTPGTGDPLLGHPPGTENMYSMRAALSGCGPYGEMGWSFYEIVEGTSTDIGPCVNLPSNNELTQYASTLAAGQMVAEWVPPVEGDVRITMRSTRDADHPGTGDIVHEMIQGHDLLEPPFKTTIITPSDTQGDVVVVRKHVTTADHLFFRVSLQGSVDPLQPAKFQWHPQIVYEGRRLTYRFTDYGPAPVNTATQKWISVPAPVGAWTSVPTSCANVGNQFLAAFGELPKAPVEIELSSPAGNVGDVDFDDLSLVRDCKWVDAPTLRKAVITESQWVRAQYRLIADRGLGQVGCKATPYEIQSNLIKTLTGPHYTTSCSCINPTPIFVLGSEPTFVAECLFHSYDDADYEDYFFIRERERRSVSHDIPLESGPPARLLYTQYDACSDTYFTGDEAMTDAGVIGSMAGLYERTNDPTCLDVAFDYGRIVSRNGIFSDPDNPDDPRNGLILSAPYRVSDGTNPHVHDPDVLDQNGEILGYANGTASLIAGYVACTNYNANHPTVPLRYDPSELATWISLIKTSASRIAAMKIYVAPNPNTGDPARWGHWESDWTALTGFFSDDYGYEGSSVVEALKSLDKLPHPLTPQSDEARADTFLRNGYLISGANYYVKHWSQAVFRGMRANADNGRTWPIFGYLCASGAPQAAVYAEQIQRATTHALRFQYRGGVWVADGQDDNQQMDTFKGPGGARLFVPPGPYPLGEGQAFLVTPPQSALFDDFLALMYSQFDTAMRKFKRTYGYRSTLLSADAADELVGSERFLCGNYLFAIDALPASTLGLPQKPAVAIAPASFNATSGDYFTFTITVQAATDEAGLYHALADSRVIRWSDVGGEWTEESLWPDHPEDFTTPSIDLANKKIWIRTQSPVVGTGPTEFKFDFHAWDDKGQWTRDTSYQKWM